MSPVQRVFTVDVLVRPPEGRSDARRTMEQAGEENLDGVLVGSPGSATEWRRRSRRESGFVGAQGRHEAPPEIVGSRSLDDGDRLARELRPAFR